MWDLFNSTGFWTVLSLIGTVIVGVLTNLLTPSVQKIYATTNNRRKAAAIKRKVRAYKELTTVSALIPGLYHYIGAISRAVAMTVLFSLTTTITMVLITTGGVKPTDDIIPIISSESYGEFNISLKFAFLIISTFAVYKTLDFLRRAENVRNSATRPEKYKLDTLKALRKIDPTFEATRLDDRENASVKSAGDSIGS